MRRVSIFVSVLFAAVLAGTVLTIHDRFAAPQANVILLTVESLRADRFAEKLAPQFFAAAVEAAAYPKHRSISSWTGPNIIALLTGLSPFEQGVHARGQSIDPGKPVFLDALAREGWTVGSVQAFAKTENFRNLGMPVDAGHSLKGWIARSALSAEPFFFWHHYLDTHLPYNPSEPELPSGIQLPVPGDAAHGRIQAVRTQPALREGSVAFEAGDKPLIEALYDGGIRDFDAWFGDFWRFYNASGLRENTILIVTADHGEELLDRGNVGHASTNAAGTLYEESVRVPLFIWWPARLRPESRPGTTDHLDLVPTLRDALGLPADTNLAGQSLLRAGPGHDWSAITSRAGFSETNPDDVETFVAARIEGTWKLIVQTKRKGLSSVELFDLAADPMERDDKVYDRPDVVAKLLPSLLYRVSRLTLPQTAPPSASGVRSGPNSVPRWLQPAQSGALSWVDLGGRALLRWSGDPSATYRLSYSLGTGPSSLSGELRVEGTEKDFGTFSEHYWRTWISPYRQVTLRVRNETSDNWSETLHITLAE